MKKLLVGLFALGSISSFAGNVVCTDGTSYIPHISSEALETFSSAFTEEFEGEGSIVLLNNLVFNVRANNDGLISMYIAKTDFGSRPIASSQGYKSTQLNININSIPELVGYRDNLKIPNKKFLESNKKYFKKIEKYIANENDRNMYLAFFEKYGQLASFTCTLKH